MSKYRSHPYFENCYLLSLMENDYIVSPFTRNNFENKGIKVTDLVSFEYFTLSRIVGFGFENTLKVTPCFAIEKIEPNYAVEAITHKPVSQIKLIKIGKGPLSWDGSGHSVVKTGPLPDGISSNGYYADYDEIVNFSEDDLLNFANGIKSEFTSKKGIKAYLSDNFRHCSSIIIDKDSNFGPLASRINSHQKKFVNDFKKIFNVLREDASVSHNDVILVKFMYNAMYYDMRKETGVTPADISNLVVKDWQ